MFKRITRYLRTAAGIEGHLQKAVGYQREMALNAVEEFYLRLGLPLDKLPHCRYVTKKRLLDLYEQNVVYSSTVETGCIFHHLERHLRLFIPFVGFDEYVGLCCDVFVDGYPMNIDRPFVMIDVGANLFNASLLFAQHPLCTKVFAYEIIPSIYETGLVNLELNPHLTHKISSFNVGLYNRSTQVEAIYYPKRSGASGISEKLEEAEWLLSTRDQDFLGDCRQRLSVRVEEARQVIEDHSRQYPEDELVIKLDAENSEAEILENLEPLFDRVYCFMVEVHSRAASQKIAAIFKREKYTRTKQAENLYVFYNQGRIDGRTGKLGSKPSSSSLLVSTWPVVTPVVEALGLL